MNNELVRMWKEGIVSFEMIIHDLCGGTEEIHEIPQLG